MTLHIANSKLSIANYFFIIELKLKLNEKIISTPDGSIVLWSAGICTTNYYR